MDWHRKRKPSPRRAAFSKLLEALFDGSLVPEIKRMIRDAENGEDPIEALHGHYCDTNCWHYAMGSEQTRAEIRELAARRKKT